MPPKVKRGPQVLSGDRRQARPMAARGVRGSPAGVARGVETSVHERRARRRAESAQHRRRRSLLATRTPEAAGDAAASAVRLERALELGPAAVEEAVIEHELQRLRAVRFR